MLLQAKPGPQSLWYQPHHPGKVVMFYAVAHLSELVSARVDRELGEPYIGISIPSLVVPTNTTCTAANLSVVNYGKDLIK